MSRTTIRNTLMGIALTIATAAGLPSQAKANDYCREYTRTVNVGGMTQDAYGTACLQPDGSWMIVGEGLGNDLPNNASNVNYVIHDNRREVIPTRVVYYDQPRVNYYRTTRPAPLFVWYNNGHYRGDKFYGYNNKHHYDRHDRRDRWDRHDNRGRGHGHGHGRGRD